MLDLFRHSAVIVVRMKVKDEVITFLKKKNITQSDLAKMAGINPSIINKLVAGKRGINSATLEKLWPILTEK